jgi:hypothetical protein
MDYERVLLDVDLTMATIDCGLPTFEDLRPQFLKAPLNLWVPDGLADHQVGWFVNLLRASLKSDLLGYLPLCAQRDCKNCPSCLWRVAGARNRGFFDKESPVVQAAFEPSQIAGRRVLYFPPLIRCLIEQQKRLRSKSKSVASGDLFSETCASFPQNGPHSSPSTSSPSEIVSERQKLTISDTREGQAISVRSFPPYKFAKRVIEMLGIPITGRNLEVIEAAIKAEAAYTGLPLDEAAERIMREAIEDRRDGKPIDKFYFEDTKWRNRNGTAGKTGAAVERVNHNRESLLAAARSHVAERVGSDGNKR